MFFLLRWCAETSPLDSLTSTKVGVDVKINVLFEDGFFKKTIPVILWMSILGIYILNKHSQLLVRTKQVGETCRWKECSG